MMSELTVCFTPGGRKQASRVDVWTIVASGDKGSTLVGSVPVKDGAAALNEKLDRLSREHNIPIAPGAKIPEPAPAP